jgi:hypothetical protein
MAKPSGVILRLAILFDDPRLENASPHAEIHLAVFGSRDAGWSATFPDLCDRAFANLERRCSVAAMIGVKTGPPF